MKLKPRTAKLLLAPAIGLCMSCAMSFVLTAINVGLNEDFVAAWLKSFGISFAVSLPVSFIIVPQIQKFFDGITEKNDELSGK
jgi:hypothetical protein